MWQYNDQIAPDELYHHGVVGMKWGKRKAQCESAKSARKEARRFMPVGVGIKGIQRVTKSSTKYSNALANESVAKAKYKAARKSDKAKADKAEFKTLVKEFSKGGLRGSAKDTQTFNRSTSLYNKIKVAKGKEYADKVEKKVQKQAYTKFAVAATVAVGSTIVSAILAKKY